MSFQRVIAWAALAVSTVGAASAGPLVFSQTQADGERVSGVRPLYERWTYPDGSLDELDFAYPIFTYRTYGDAYQWNLFQLVRHYGRRDTGPNAGPEARTLQIWPFYFSRTSPVPGESYRALIPVGGTLRDFLTYDRLSFVLFPLYVQSEKHGAVTTADPWPFITHTRGSEHGFAVWPFYVASDRPGAWSRRFYLWPFIWRGWSISGKGPEVIGAVPLPAGAPSEPTRTVGVLPFYASVKGPTLASTDWFWPFFGNTDKTSAPVYHETRYFWPFLVQGRGPQEYRNRWGPLYTHSIVYGMDKVWAPWPLVKRLRWQEGGLVKTKTQFGYFLYWKGEERKASNPAAAPAYLVHFWPFVTLWDNGAGRRQWEAPSPVAEFFPNNREVKAGWEPLVTLVRHAREPDGSTRTSLLWNAIAWSRRPDGHRSFRVFALEFPRHPGRVTRTAQRP